MKRKALCLLACLATGSASWAATIPSAYLTTPSACDTIERKEAEKVWLISPADCESKPGRMRIEAPAGQGEIEIYVNGVYKETQALQRYDMAGVQAVLTDAETLAKSLQVDKPVNPASPAVAAAKQSAENFFSPGYQAKLKAERDRLQKDVFAPVMQEYYPEEAAKQLEPGGKLTAAERIYVFISSSIPEATLRTYLAQADKVREPNMIFVLRGLVGGAKQVGPTVAFIGNVLKKDEQCDLKIAQRDTYLANVQVDPLLFARYQITQVPALVYSRDVSVAEGFGKSEGLSSEVPVGQSWQVDGDAALDRLLEVVNREAKSSSVEQLILAMRKGFY